MPLSSAPVALATPSAALLDGYTAALRAGWSPSSARDVSARYLAEIAADPGVFLANLARTDGGTIDGPDGAPIARLPGPIFWITDGAFCGNINLRYAPGTIDLPTHVSGHIGYAVVPWKRGRGIARAALMLLLPVARELGLPRVKLTCDVDNVASRRVIEACGGRPTEPTEFRGAAKRQFWIET